MVDYPGVPYASGPRALFNVRQLTVMAVSLPISIIRNARDSTYVHPRDVHLLSRIARQNDRHGIRSSCTYDQ